MAVYVGIRKVASGDQFVEYEFGPNEEQVGLLRISKATGETDVLQAVPGDDQGTYSIMATRKVVQHYQKGEFPEKTCWAS